MESKTRSSFSHVLSPHVQNALEEYDEPIAAIVHLQSSKSETISASDSQNGEIPLESLNASRTKGPALIRREDLARISLIGTGRFSKVHLAAGPSWLLSEDSSTKERRPSSLVAVKSINVSRIQDDSDFGLVAGEIANEVKILSQLEHKNIVRLLGVCSESFSESFRGEGYFLVLEVLRETLSDRLQQWRRQKQMMKKSRSLGGYLCSFVKKNDQVLRSVATNSNRFSSSTSVTSIDTETSLDGGKRRLYHRIRDTVLGVADGLEYLHSKGIVLRDLKPANIGYVNTSDVHYGTVRSDIDDGDESSDLVRLFDFGMAEQVELCDRFEMCGSLRYMAPEAMNGEGYSFKVDVYSFGVVLFEICSLCHPFAKSLQTKKKQRTDKTVVQKQIDVFYNRVLAGEIRPFENMEESVCCPELRDLIKDCCEMKPMNRPTLTAIRSRLASIFNASMNSI